ncbi:grpE protein homolog 1, mitochondrial-like isoform X2 [Clavelina lepadiformis]|uniref:grpE protein homolog 1, mitochondrial-like isoform X2 n=1 Tax=Clavelina lepadiformis TaxID=159417 RepID=UPI004042A89C
MIQSYTMLTRRATARLATPQLRIWLLSSHLRGRKFSSEANTQKLAEGSDDKKEEVSTPDAEIKKLNESIVDLTEKYKRALAETENVRMRLRKEIADAKHFGIQTFCKDLLTVADVLHMAIKSIPDEHVNKDSTEEPWKSFYKGVCLTDKELHNVFERHGLMVMEPNKGDKFDPNDHEAMFESPIEGMEPGLVSFIQRTGYKLRGRTLRAAQVGVSGKPI